MKKRINPETILEDSIFNLIDKLHIAKKNNTKKDITTWKKIIWLLGKNSGIKNLSKIIWSNESITEIKKSL